MTRPRPIRALGGWTVTLLSVDAALGLLSAAQALVERRLLRRVATDGELSVEASLAMQEAVRGAAARRWLLDVGTLGATIATAIVFLVWFHRAYDNLAALGKRPRTTARAALLGWFVPIGNFYLPYRSAQELRAHSAAALSNWVVFGWWASWLLGLLLGRLGALALKNGDLSRAALFDGAAGIAVAASASLGVVFVARVSRAQSGRTGRGEPSPGP